MHQPPSHHAALGVDFGGTKIEAAVLDPAGSVLWRERVPNPGEYRRAIDAVGGLVKAAEQAVGRSCTVGIGAPGAIDAAAGAVRNAPNLTGFAGEVPLGPMLSVYFRSGYRSRRDVLRRATARRAP